jgi:hypothetical protein
MKCYFNIVFEKSIKLFKNIQCNYTKKKKESKYKYRHEKLSNEVIEKLTLRSICPYNNVSK